jgi:hypothetical protein
MTKKHQLKILSHTATVLKDEFHNCDAPGCRNIISIVDRPKSGPIYCVLHSHRKKS